MTQIAEAPPSALANELHETIYAIIQGQDERFGQLDVIDAVSLGREAVVDGQTITRELKRSPTYDYPSPDNKWVSLEARVEGPLYLLRRAVVCTKESVTDSIFVRPGQEAYDVISVAHVFQTLKRWRSVDLQAAALPLFYPELVRPMGMYDSSTEEEQAMQKNAVQHGQRICSRTPEHSEISTWLNQLQNNPTRVELPPMEWAGEEDSLEHLDVIRQSLIQAEAYVRTDSRLTYHLSSIHKVGKGVAFLCHRASVSKVMKTISPPEIGESSQ